MTPQNQSLLDDTPAIVTEAVAQAVTPARRIATLRGERTSVQQRLSALEGLQG
jgi:hypothetical protein